MMGSNSTAASPQAEAATLVEQFTSWSQGIQHELAFWREIARTGGGRWPDDFQARMNPETPVVSWLEGLARGQGTPACRVLDVGAGPITLLGHRSPEDLRIEIVATDALAAAYGRIFDEAGLQRPNATSFAPAEELSAFFAPSSFDVVHCCNALDHSFDPMRGIVEMLRVVRVGGTILLAHTRNEAEAEGYSGFHQHNFDAEDGRFVIWRPGLRVDVAAHIPVACRIAIEGTDFLKVEIVKLEEFPPEGDDRFRFRLTELLSGLTGFLVRHSLQGKGAASE